MSEKKAKQNRKENPERDYTAERDARCNPVIMEIFKCITEMPQAPLNTELLSKEECYKIYFDANKKITNIITGHDLDITTDLEHIWQGVKEIVTITETVVNESIKQNQAILNESLFDIKYGEPALYSSVRLAKMVKNKDKISEAIKEILINDVLDESVGEEIK